MTVVEIDSNAILIEPMTTHKDKEMKQAYQYLLLCLKRTGIILQKHILSNKVSESKKYMIRDDYNMELELVLLRFHCCNAAEVAIFNF